MIFVGPYLNNPNSHFSMNVVDGIGKENDLIIDIKEEEETYLSIIQEYLKDRNIKDEICIYNPYEKEDFVIKIKQKIPELKIFMYCSDDEWRCFTYDRYLALYVDFFSITAKKHLNLYKKWGFKNIIGTNWACNPKKFYPILSMPGKIYDVTFIGTAYGQRIDYIRAAIRNNVNIKVFGKGWNNYSDIKPFWGGYVSSYDMNTIINQSKINLNFMWSSQGKYQVKGRNFELSGCKAFQLCNYGEELLEYFEPKKNIDTFIDKKEFLEKINYYLNNEEERVIIANNAYHETIKKHTWNVKFKEIFEFGLNKHQNITRKYNILVINEKNVSHNINTNDVRLKIDFAKKETTYDGIIKLTKDSTINNETLLLMVFSLDCDKSDFVMSNFYIDNNWIRFRDKNLKRQKKLLKIIPIESIMFSNETTISHYLSKHNSSSYIEYPTYTIKDIAFITKIFLKLLFSSYSQREKLTEYKKSKNIFGIAKISCEYLIRKLILI